MMVSLAEVREELGAKSDYLFRIRQEAGPDLDLSKITSLDGDNQSKMAEMQRLDRELSALGVEKDRLEGLEAMLKLNDERQKQMHQASGNGVAFPGLGGSDSSSRGFQDRAKQGLREFLVNHKGYREFREGRVKEAAINLDNVEWKTLITLTTVSPQNLRQPGLVNMPLEERTIADLMLEGTIDRPIVEYYEETTVTNAASTVTEGSAKPEAALAYTLRSENARKVAVWIPATDEALNDVSFLESQIRGRLAFMVRRREEQQLLSGNGTAPDLRGILNRSGIQTQAKGTDPVPDAIYRAMQKVRGAAGSGFAEPTAVVLHPNDWTDIKLLRTADGMYIWGNPSDEGPDRIWGLPVRQTTEITENTGLVGAFRPYAEVLRRAGITVTVSTEHSTYFIENRVAILAEERLALAVYRPSAFATVTGI